MPPPVVLVTEEDQPVGTAEKLRAHREGWLHRALSVFVFDPAGRLLLQQRSGEKYHSGGLWSNTCCSHPYPEEAPSTAAGRRLEEEMGFTCALTPALHFRYRAPVDAGLTEHEYDHVFVGRVDDIAIRPDPAEVADWAWMDASRLRTDVAARPDRYTVWFRRLLPSVLDAADAPVAADAPAGDGLP
jgi:isopentenyl-diphosphate delta-isomerase